MAILFRILFTGFFIAAGVSVVSAQLHRDLSRTYERFLEPTIEDRRFKQADIAPLIQRLSTPFEVQKAGASMEGRDIFLVRYGRGPVKVLLWSQMHGDESTATMALMDIFNFLSAGDDEFSGLRRRLRERLSIYFVPMLNPDGAERFTRRNALGIDLNRDAIRLQTPEARLLKRVRDELDADWGFNLHDQSRYYSAGDTAKQASISFLAPAFNEDKDINDVREKAMKLIGLLNEVLQAYIPAQVGKYSDSFEPRAFGDNIQKWGTSTILIETGGMPGDPEKQFLRKMNYLALLTAFDAIANRSYRRRDLSEYKDIPYNDGNSFFDLLLREVQVERLGQWYTVDIGLRRREREYDNHRRYQYEGYIADIGDLSIFHGYDELPAAGYRALPGKGYYQILKNEKDLKKLDLISLLEQGYTDFFVAALPRDNRYHTLPIRLIDRFDPNTKPVELGSNPSLLLQKDGEIRYLVVNGFLFDFRKDRALLKQLLQEVLE